MKVNLVNYYPTFGLLGFGKQSEFDMPNNKKELMATFGSFAVEKNADTFFTAQHWGALRTKFKATKDDMQNIPYQDFLGETLSNIRKRALIHDTRIVTEAQSKNGSKFDTTEQFYSHLSKIYFSKLNAGKIGTSTNKELKEYYRHCAGSYKAGKTHLDKYLPEQITTTEEIKTAFQNIAASFFYFADVETDETSFQHQSFKNGFSQQEALEYIDAVRNCFLADFSIYDTPTDELQEMLKLCKETQTTAFVKEYLGICDLLGYNKHECHEIFQEKSHLSIAIAFYAYNKLDVFIKIRTALQQAEQLLLTSNSSTDETPKNSKMRSKAAK